jgi:hypothetical protein
MSGEEVRVDVAVITMVRDESAMLPRWLRHYGAQFGERNLYVLDDQSQDGSTSGLAATVISMPKRATSSGDRVFGAFKSTVANKLGAALLEMYDVVILVDADEFIVPDPRRYSGLREYLERHPDADVLAPVGVNLVHVPDREPTLDPTMPLLRQRRHVKVVPGMCKPAIKRIPARWTGGTHGIRAPYGLSRDLYLVHAKYADRAAALTTHEGRHSEFLTAHAGRTATWRLKPAEIADRWTSWARSPDSPAVLDFDTLDLSGVVRAQPKGIYRSYGPQTSAMDDGEMYVLPDYLTDQV